MISRKCPNYPKVIEIRLGNGKNKLNWRKINRKDLELKSDIKYKTCLGYVPIPSSALRPLGAANVPILLSEVEQEQRPSGNGVREAIVVGAGLCEGEGERAYTALAPHFDIFAFRKPLSKQGITLDASLKK